VTIGVPVRTRDFTTTAPPKMLCVAVPSASRPTASVRMPLRVRIASRAAISLPSAVDASSTAAGDVRATSEASTSAWGVARCFSTSGDSAT
jgi:hypothetical protein